MTRRYTDPGSPEEFRVVSGLMEATSRLNARLDSVARHSQGTSLPQLDILFTIARAPENRLRMADLADALVVSRSGITYRVDVLERRGLVTRTPSAGDQRETVVELTEPGWRIVDEAAPVQYAELREALLSSLTPEELAGLAATLERVLVTLRRPTRHVARPRPPHS